MTTASNSPATSADFKEFAASVRVAVEQALDRILPAETVSPQNVHRAMRWSVFAGGKRFRPLLLVSTAEAFGTPRSTVLSTASALELIHTYSLVHDDLPSMDDDDLRRGQQTCHIRFGEATAILAGDALQTLAFQTISEDGLLSFETRVRLISEITRASGTPFGMVAGQAEDLDAESREVTTKELDGIHRLKTGALITAAARCGAIIAQATSAELAVVTRYAEQLGLLFQITDDLLDVTATAEALGKTPGKDARSQKATYPGVYGIDSAWERALQVHAQTRSVLAELQRPTEVLHAIADFILQRHA